MSTFTKFGISGAAAALILMRFVLPQMTIDAITIGLLIVAALPWLAPLIESFTLPGGTEVKLRDMQVAESKIESLEADLEQMKALTLVTEPQAAGRGGAERGGMAGSVDEAPLRAMADRYMAIDDPDWAKRVRLKDQAAREMGNFVLTHAVSRDSLAQQDHEGLVLALAGAIHASPEAGDGQRLLQAGENARRLHVKYRVAMAFARLAENNFLSANELSAIRRLLKAYRRGADESLKSRIDKTEAVLETADYD